jgi:DNA-binding GntR family transcriptional regulator
VEGADNSKRTPAKPLYLRLRDDLLDGKFEEGVHLGEVGLAARYNVSRTPIREALSRLEQDRIIERVGRNFSVRPRTPEEILEIYEVRALLEGATARSAANRRTDLDLVKLRSAHGAMVKYKAKIDKDMADLNRQFHQTIWVASHNSTLSDLLERLESRLLRYSATTLGQPGRWRAALDEHEQLIQAIDARDGATAEDIATRHMTAARDVRLQMFGTA